MRVWQGWQVWRGGGVLVLFLIMLGLKAASAAAHCIWGELRSETARSDVIAIGLLLGAALVLVLDIGLRRFARSRVLGGQMPGGTARPVPKHEFLLVPVEVWPHLLTAAGIAVLFHR